VNLQQVVNNKPDRFRHYISIILGLGLLIVYASIGSHQDWDFAFRNGALGDTSRVAIPYWGLFLSYLPAQIEQGYIIWLGVGLFLLIVASMYMKSSTWIILLSYQLNWCLWYGQIDPYVVFGLVLGYWALNKSRPYILGIAIMLILIKPQIGLLPAIFMFYLSSNKSKTSLIALSIFTASLLIWPSWIKFSFAHWSTYTDRFENQLSNTYNLSLWITVPAVLIALPIQRSSLQKRLLSLVAANLLLVPYSPIYSQLSLLVFPLNPLLSIFAFIPWIVAIHYGPFFHWGWAQIFPLLALIYSAKEGKMIIISFGKWDYIVNRLFIRERIWLKGYIWTPFCKISLNNSKGMKI
jgi:hypothetical protein